MLLGCWIMITFALSWRLIFVSLLIQPALCQAYECKEGIASAPLQTKVSGLDCLQRIQAKACAPAGKAVKTSSVIMSNASPNIDFESELKNVDGGCVEAKLKVWSRNEIGLSILHYCPDGFYEGRLQITYCR